MEAEEMLRFTNPYTGKECDAVLKRGMYAINKRMFIGLMTFDPEYGFWEPWCDITVNLPHEQISGENMAFVDTNNLGNYIPEFLEKNGLAARTGRIVRSGYCEYPEMQFEIEKVDKYTIDADW